MKKILCAVLAVVMLACCLTGCSTPRVAMTVNDKEYTTGEYLAYLYNAYNQLYYTQLYYYASYGYTEEQLWEMTFPYGEEDEEVELELAEYLKRSTQDTMIRQKAVEDMMAKYGITLSEEDLKDLDSQIEGMTDADVLPLGFNLEHYRSMVKAMSYNEDTLFKALFDVGGSEGTTAEELRDYFDENYLSYKSIEISLTDDAGEELPEEEVDAVKKRLQGYLDEYKKTGDFDAVIKKFNEEEAAATTTTTTTGSNTTTATTATETTTTTTTTTTETEATGETTTTETTTTTDPNLVNIEGADYYTDEDFLNALKEVKEGEAKIVEYKKNGTTATMALVLRLDPETANGKEYYENSREGILYNAKYDTFDDMVKAVVADLTVDVSKRAVSMCDPKELYSSLS